MARRLAEALPPALGRVHQKERTRQALLTATRTLLAEGQPVTIARAAAHALVSEPTAYRYYSDARSLLRDALAVQWPTLDGVLCELRTMPSIAARARYAAEAMAHVVLANEAQIRALIALSYEPAEPGQDGGEAISRPAFRMTLIDAVLEAESGRPELAMRRQRLQHALAVIIAAEAVLSLKDAMGCSSDEIVSTLGWAASKVVLDE